MRISLNRHVVRRLPVFTLAVAAAFGAVFVAWFARRSDDPIVLVRYLRCPTIVLAATAALFLDDVAAPLLDVAPLGRARRRAIDAMVAVVLVLATWAVTAMIGFMLVDGPHLVPASFPWGASLLEVVALTALSFAVMCAFGRFVGGRSGPRVAMSIGVVAVMTMSNDRLHRWMWWDLPVGQQWRDAHLRWAVLGMAAVVVAIGLSRDPARR